MSWNINRRRFLETASAALAMSALGADGVDIVHGKKRRVALIGTGWYGKSDVFRLIQVAHAEICCYYHMRANGNPPVQPVPDYLDYEMWTRLATSFLG